jgi:hypothetical protein
MNKYNGLLKIDLIISYHREIKLEIICDQVFVRVTKVII